MKKGVCLTPFFRIKMFYNHINANLSLLFLKISLFLLGFTAFLPQLSSSLFNNYFCSFLILTIGLSHGSLDNLKGIKLLKYFKLKNVSIFYVIYILLSLLSILFWINYPVISLLFLLILGSYHFGKEDLEFIEINKNIFKNLLFLLKGLIAVSAPLLFNFNETINIFILLSNEHNYLITIFNYLNENNYITLVVLLSFITTVYLPKDLKTKFLIYVEFSSILILNYIFTPFIAFTIYFCFLHSLRHIIGLNKNLLNYKLDTNRSYNIYKLLINFYKYALKLTAISSLIFILGFYTIYNNQSLDSSIYKIIFPGLAALTIPHILLEYLYESFID